MTPEEMAATHEAAFADARPWSATEFADLLSQRFCHAVGDPACFALIRVVADEAELLTIATHPDHQRHGLARTRMADWQALAVSLGAARGFLEVAADNIAAMSLYQSCGFAVCGRRDGYYARTDAAPVDAILMSRDLT